MSSPSRGFVSRAVFRFSLHSESQLENTPTYPNCSLQLMTLGLYIKNLCASAISSPHRGATNPTSNVWQILRRASSQLQRPHISLLQSLLIYFVLLMNEDIRMRIYTHSHTFHFTACLFTYTHYLPKYSTTRTRAIYHVVCTSI